MKKQYPIHQYHRESGPAGALTIGCRTAGTLFLMGAVLAVGTAVQAAGPEGVQRAAPQPVAAVIGLGLLVLGALLVKAGRVGAALLATAIFPQAVTRARASVAAWPIRLFLLGVANGLAGLIVALVLLSRAKTFHILILLALALVVLLIGLALVGRAGFFGWIGRRLGASSVDGSSEVLRGGLVWETATLTPLLGLLADLVALAISLGAGTLVLFSRGDRRDRETAAETPQALEKVEHKNTPQ